MQLWKYRGLVHELVIRDIKVRYKSSVLGILWTMLAPLLNMVALTLVFSAILKTGDPELPRLLHDRRRSSGPSSRRPRRRRPRRRRPSNELAKRMFVPRSVFVASAVGGGLVNLRALARAAAPDPRGDGLSVPRHLGLPARLDLHRRALHGRRLAPALHGDLALRRRPRDVHGARPDLVLPDADRVRALDRAVPVPRVPVAESDVLPDPGLPEADLRRRVLPLGPISLLLLRAVARGPRHRLGLLLPPRPTRWPTGAEPRERPPPSDWRT